MRLKYRKPKIDSEYDNYNCKTHVVPLIESTEQPQTKATWTLSEVERENECELIQGQNKSTDLFGDSDLNILRLRIKIHKLNNDRDLKFVEVEEKENNNKSLDTLSEGMIWYIRLGQASVRYFRRLGDTDEYFSKIRFENDIRDCEACILAKIVKRPFKEERGRDSKPLYRA